MFALVGTFYNASSGFLHSLKYFVIANYFIYPSDFFHSPPFHISKAAKLTGYAVEVHSTTNSVYYVSPVL